MRKERVADILPCNVEEIVFWSLLKDVQLMATRTNSQTIIDKRLTGSLRPI